MSTQSLIDRVAAGEPNAVARAISKVEDGSADNAELMKQLFPRTGRALVIGITGSPGAGKSSLVDKLAGFYRKRGDRVGIIAVDPSSPFSGGAILGDRIRMQSLALDKGVFIRSMATRGNLGGLARSTIEAAAILDAAGFEKIIIETVGVGQDEIEIAKTVAIESKGIEELAAAIEGSRVFQRQAPASSERRTAIARWRILELLR